MSNTKLAYTTSTPHSSIPKPLVAAYYIARNPEAYAAIERHVCSYEWCFVCGIADDHYGQHATSIVIDAAFEMALGV